MNIVDRAIKIGDEVKLLSWDEITDRSINYKMYDNFIVLKGGFIFYKSMKYLCGESFVVGRFIQNKDFGLMTEVDSWYIPIKLVKKIF